MERNQTYDYIVVGGGTAGVVIASRLSQYLPQSTIALVEAGPNAVDHPDIVDPTGFIKLWATHDPLVVDYSTTPQEQLNNRQILNPGGRLLSGSSGINVGVWMRASDTDYQVISESAGHDRFKFENVLQYFNASETYWDKDANPKYHGFDGPVYTVGGRKYPLREDIQQAYEKLGYQYNAEPRAGDPTGLAELTQSYIATSSATSERQHSGRVYDLSKVDIICDTPVARILFNSSKQAEGVELVNGKKLNALKEVIISCGTQKSPQLLMLSGIGPKDELSEHNIPVLVDSPQVGQNLFDHSSLILYFKLKHPEQGLSLPFQGTMKPEYGQGLPWDWNAFGNIAPSALAPLLKSDGETSSAHPHLRDKRCHFMTIPHYFPVLATEDYNPEIQPMDGKHIAFSAIHLLPISRGTVTLKSADGKDEPAIDPKFMSTNTDRYIFRHAVREVLALTETAPFSGHLAGETPPADSKYPALTMESTDGEIDARIKGFMGTVAHPMGTCALGSVLDASFRVKGVQGLRVCDASVFPEPIGAMPQATVYAIGEMCAELVAKGERIEG